jgi:hypothetical protein
MNGNEAEAPTHVTLVDLIDGLVEPAPPEAVPLTPQTWGWAVLGVMAVAAAGWLIWRRLAVHRSNAYRRAALGELASAATATEVAEILRRTALAAYPRADVASLTGTAWVAFLERSGAEDWPSDAARQICEAPWRDETAPPAPALRTAAERWTRRHDRTVAVAGGIRPTPEVTA